MSEEPQDNVDILDHEHLEATLLFAVGALLSNANRASTEKGCGFRFVPEGLVVEWPAEVQQAMGLKPTDTLLVNEEERICRLLFEPCDADIGRSYWNLLFPQNPPSLVFEYSVGDDDVGNVITPTIESWLVWPWHVSSEEKTATLESALSAQSTLEAAIDWLAAAMVSGNEQRPALFDAVAEHLRD